MSKPVVGPAFPCYASDFLGSTRCTLMTPEQRGGYFWLLLHSWGAPECSLPSDERALAVLSGLNSRWEDCRLEIMECFEAHPNLPGKLANLRLYAIWLERAAFHESASERGKAGAGKRWGSHSSANGSANGYGIATPIANGMANDSSPLPLPLPSPLPEKTTTSAKKNGRERGQDDFDAFWKAYPRKQGKGAARKAWLKAKPNLATVLAAIASQRKSDQWVRDGGQFIPQPATWLNQERWEDQPTEVPPEKTDWDGVPVYFTCPDCGDFHNVPYGTPQHCTKTTTAA